MNTFNDIVRTLTTWGFFDDGTTLEERCKKSTKDIGVGDMALLSIVQRLEQGIGAFMEWATKIGEAAFRQGARKRITGAVNEFIDPRAAKHGPAPESVRHYAYYAACESLGLRVAQNWSITWISVGVPDKSDSCRRDYVRWMHRKENKR